MVLILMSCIAIVIAGCLIGFISISFAEKDKKTFDFLIMFFLFIFLLRIILSMWFYYDTLHEVGYWHTNDAFGYTENAFFLKELWDGGMRNFLEMGQVLLERHTTYTATIGTYDYWSCAIAVALGEHPLIFAFLNSAISSLTAVLVYLITLQLSDNRQAAKCAAILTGLWPSLLLWSIQNLKEPMTTFLITATVLILISLRKKFRLYYFALLALFAVALHYIRGVVFTMLYGLVLPLSMFFYLKVYKLKKEILIAVALSVVLLCLANFPALSEASADFVMSKASAVQSLRGVRAHGSLAFFEQIDFSNPAKLFTYAPILMLISFLAPFPWQVSSASQVMAVPEMCLYYCFLPFLFKGARFVIKNRPEEGGVVVVALLVVYVVLGFVEGNVGTLFRHRAIILPLFFVLSGIGLKLPGVINEKNKSVSARI